MLNIGIDARRGRPTCSTCCCRSPRSSRSAPRTRASSTASIARRRVAVADRAAAAAAELQPLPPGVRARPERRHARGRHARGLLPGLRRRRLRVPAAWTARVAAAMAAGREVVSAVVRHAVPAGLPDPGAGSGRHRRDPRLPARPSTSRRSTATTPSYGLRVFTSGGPRAPAAPTPAPHAIARGDTPDEDSCKASPTSAATSTATRCRPTSSARRPSTCSAWTSGCGTSPSSTTSTASTARIRTSSCPRERAAPRCSRASRRSTTTCSRTRGRRAGAAQRAGGADRRGNAVFLFFDERDRGALREARPARSASRRRSCASKIDNKIMTTRIGNEAGVHERAQRPGAGEELGRPAAAVAKRHGLGDELVVQTAFGDSGHTTFFIASERDYRKHAEEIEREKEVKVMKRIRCRGSALEACVTRHGTIVGPAHDRARRLQGADALQGRLVRQRGLRRGVPAEGPRLGARVGLQDRRGAAQARLPRLLRARLPDRPRHRATSTSARSTRASPAPAR